jgi:hypothetical protein
VAPKSTRAFVEFLLKDTTSPVWVGSLPNERGPGVRTVHTRDADRIYDFVDKYDVKGRSVYYCVSTIKGNERRTIETADELKFIFVDIDYKDVVENPKEIDARISKLDCPPSRIHRTGNGLHLLWDLKQPLTDMNKARRLLRAACKMMGADPHVCHPAAYMRMPGTHDSKFNKWTLVKASMPSDLGYDIKDLITFFCGHGPRLSEGFPAAQAMVPVLTRKDRDDLNPFLSFAKSVGFQPPIDVDQRLKDMQFGGGGEKGIHATQIAVEALWEATRAAVQGRPDWNWERERENIRCDIKSAQKKGIGPKPDQAKAGISLGAGAKPKSGQVDRRDDDDDPPEAQVINLNQVRAQRAAKDKKLASHVVIGGTLLSSLVDKSEQLLYPIGKDVMWYATGLWQRFDKAEETDLVGQISQEICTALKITPSNRLTKEVMGELRRLCAVQGVEWDAHGKIAISGHLIDPVSGKTGPLKPEHYATRAIDVVFNEKAKCLWGAALSSGRTACGGICVSGPY